MVVIRDPCIPNKVIAVILYLIVVNYLLNQCLLSTTQLITIHPLLVKTYLCQLYTLVILQTFIKKIINICIHFHTRNPLYVKRHINIFVCPVVLLDPGANISKSLHCQNEGYFNIWDPLCLTRLI